MFNIVGEILDKNKNNRARNIFIKNDFQMTYSSFEESVQSLAYALNEQNIGLESRVLLLANNNSNWMITLFATLYVGAAAIVVNPGLSEEEVKSILKNSSPNLIFSEKALFSNLKNEIDVPLYFFDDDTNAWNSLSQGKELLEKPKLVYESQPAILFYTSGTTGLPKGVVHTHKSIKASTSMFSKHLSMNPQDKSLVVGSLAFILHLFLNTLSTIQAGGTVIFIDRFHPEIVAKIIDLHKVTLIMAVPTVYIMLSNWARQSKDINLNSIRWAVSSGSPLPFEVYEKIRIDLNIPIYDLWGLSECAPIATYYPFNKKVLPSSCGKALPNTEILILDSEFKTLTSHQIGEVFFKSTAMMHSYFNNELATKELFYNGYMRSGDLGYIDQDGYLYLIGRKKEIIIRGGSNIYPSEIEKVIYLLNSVMECAVVGIPDEIFGETIGVFLVLQDSSNVNEQEIIDHCRKYLAEYKIPTLIKFSQELPKGPTGKILKRKLIESYIGTQK